MTASEGAAMDASAELESRYRRVLRFFPGPYRRDRQDEVLGVLLASAAPGQRRPARGEVAALLVHAGRVWVRIAVSADRIANHRAGCLLAVLLPVLMLIPVARTAVSVVTLPWSFLVTNRPDQGAWALWGLAALAVLVGPAWLPRWLAAAGTVWFGGVVAWGAVTGQTGVVSAGFGYLAVQVTACCLLADPERVRTGRRLLRPYRWAALGAAAVIVALIGVPMVPGLFIGDIYLPGLLLTAAIITATVIGLFHPTGRALLTVCGVLFAVFVAGHGWWTGIGSMGVFQPTSNMPDPVTLLWLLALPLLTWVVLRAATSVISRGHPFAR